jgi:hypothetical protein
VKIKSTNPDPIQAYYGDYERFAGEAVQFAKRARDAGANEQDHEPRSLAKGR